MGTLWRRSGLVERDRNDERATGAKAYFYLGGTTTPLVVYQDAAESVPHPTPVRADASGRWPQVFIPYTTSFDEKVIAYGGTQLSYFQQIPNVDPVRAADQTVDENQLLQTGDWIFRPAGGTRSGFVRGNGRTIGSALSGASERANDDTEALFVHLWNSHADGICPVTGGRGASAGADFAANKPIKLIDARSAVLRGVDDMGNIAAGLLDGIPTITGDTTTGGSAVGGNSHALTTAELAAHMHGVSLTTSSEGAHSHAGTTNVAGGHNHTLTDPGHFHNSNGGAPFYVAVAGGNSFSGGVGFGFDARSTDSRTTGITIAAVGDHAHSFSTSTIADHTHSVTGSTASEGSGAAHPNVSRSILGTFYIKL